MSEASNDQMRAIWKQNEVPVILRTEDGNPLRLKIPGGVILSRRLAIGHWLRGQRQRKPKWDYRYSCWEVPKSWLNDMVQQILIAYKEMYLIQPYREQEKCAPACFNAKGHDCQCSCMGANHGAGGPGAGWFVVSDTFASRCGEKHLACRLMKLK